MIFYENSFKSMNISGCTDWEDKGNQISWLFDGEGSNGSKGITAIFYLVLCSVLATRISKVLLKHQHESFLPY